ncbi:hypothetical protein TNCV_402451 [Trichonephila clavipes]|nr:hypothetical protein TNCV_402451 [Trichonephila clavipes]
MDLERAEAVARFHLVTVHDILEVYLQWLDLAVNKACPLCGHFRMDAMPVLCSNSFDSMNTRLKTSGLPKSTDKFRGAIVCSIEMSNPHRKKSLKPRLVGENYDNNSPQEHGEPAEGNGQANEGTWNAEEGFKKTALMPIFHSPGKQHVICECYISR